MSEIVIKVEGGSYEERATLASELSALLDSLHVAHEVPGLYVDPATHEERVHALSGNVLIRIETGWPGPER